MKVVVMVAANSIMLINRAMLLCLRLGNDSQYCSIFELPQNRNRFNFPSLTISLKNAVLDSSRSLT